METTQEEVKTYIDTNLWIAYYNATLFGGPKFKKAEFAIKLFESFTTVDAHIVFSYFNYIELSEVLRDTLISLRLLGEGYSVFKLSVVRKNNTKLNNLSDMEEGEHAKALAKLTSFKFLKTINTEKAEGIDEEMAENLYLLTGSFHIEMPDALHIVYAMKNDCKYFITNDASLINNFRKAQSEIKDFKSLKIKSPEDIIQKPAMLLS